MHNDGRVLLNQSKITYWHSLYIPTVVNPFWRGLGTLRLVFEWRDGVYPVCSKEPGIVSSKNKCIRKPISTHREQSIRDGVESIGFYKLRRWGKLNFKRRKNITISSSETYLAHNWSSRFSSTCRSPFLSVVWGRWFINSVLEMY